MAPPRWFLRLFWIAHAAVFRVSGGRVGVRAPGSRIGALFLLSRGRISGTVRRNALFYVTDGPDLVVVASNAGDAADPQWWSNLQAGPDVEVELPGRERRPVRARRATPGEEARLIPRLDALYREFASYRARGLREIPIVILEPRPVEQGPARV